MLVFPAYDGTLHDMLQRGEIRTPVMLKMIGQLLRALRILTTHHVLHRDIKPRNILVRDNEPLVVCLSDFGSGVFLAEELANGALKSGVCTRGYEAPEMLWHRPYGHPSDVWSLGVVMIEAAIGRHPFGYDATTRQGVLRRIYDICIQPGAPGAAQADKEDFATSHPSRQFRERQCPTCLTAISLRNTPLTPILASMLKVHAGSRASCGGLLETHASFLY